MIYGYIRVSSDKQTVENQRFEINNFCERYKLVIDGWIEETISGMKSYNKRELGRLLLQIQKDDLIIVCRIITLGKKSVHDYGDIKYLYDQRMSCVDYKRQLSPW